MLSWTCIVDDVEALLDSMEAAQSLHELVISLEVDQGVTHALN